MKVLVSEEIESVCPGFVGAAVSAEVVNTKYNEDLWKEIEELGGKVSCRIHHGDNKAYIRN